MDRLIYPENPFTPSFGEIPLFMAGREQLISSLDRAFLRSGRSPERTHPTQKKGRISHDSRYGTGYSNLRSASFPMATWRFYARCCKAAQPAL